MIAAVLLAPAVLGASVPAAQARAATVYPTPTGPVDYDKLAQQIAERVNDARMHPDALADQIDGLVSTYDGYDRLKLSDGSDVYVNTPSGSSADKPGTKKRYVTQSATEARTQPVLPALPWSDLLANYAKQWLPYEPQWGHGGQPGAPARPKPTGLTQPIIEGAGGADANPLVFVYQGWIDVYALWDLNGPWDPSQNWQVQKGDPRWRGHRGGINDQQVKSIGVACGPHSYPWDPKRASATCIIDAYYGDAPDASPVATPSSGTADLAALKMPVTGKIGDDGGGAGTGGTTAVTVDTNSPTPSPTPNTIDGTIPSPPGSPASVTPTATAPSMNPTAGTSTAGGNPTPSCSAVEAPTGDLKFGATYDPLGTGCLLITVTQGDEFEPSPEATSVNGLTLKYRKYTVTFDSRASSTFMGGDVFKPTCQTVGGSKLPFVYDDAKNGIELPKTPYGQGTSSFSFGCGVDDVGQATRVFAVVTTPSSSSGIGWSAAGGKPSAPANNHLSFSYRTVKNATGEYQQGTPVGNDPDLSTDPTINDRITSITVPDGEWVSLYSDINYQGDCQSFATGTTDLNGSRIGTRTSSYKLSQTAPVDCSPDN